VALFVIKKKKYESRLLRINYDKNIAYIFYVSTKREGNSVYSYYNSLLISLPTGPVEEI